MLNFWREIANELDDEGGAPDYEYIVRRLHELWLDETLGPIYGPPLPPTLMDKILKRYYLPGLRANIERSSKFHEWVTHGGES